MVRILALSLALVLLASAPVAAEEEETTYGRTGPYGGAGLMFGLDTFDNVVDDVSRNLQRRPSCTSNNQTPTGCVHRPLGPPQVDLGPTGGLDAWVGWRVHRYLALEAEAEWMAFLGFQSDENMPTADLSFPGTIARKLKLDIDTLVITANLKPYLSGGRIQPFALLGAGIMLEEFGVEYDGINDDEHHKDFAMRFGGGADYYATENIVLTIKGSYVLPFGTVADRSYVSLGMLGVTYRF